MSVFTVEEISYLRDNKLGRLATADAEGQPHAIPVTYFFNEAEDTIDVGGLNFGAGKKWRDVEQNPKVAFLVDDVIGPPRRARAVEVRGACRTPRDGWGGDQSPVPELRAGVHPDPPDADRELGHRGSRHGGRSDRERRRPQRSRRGLTCAFAKWRR